VKTASEKTYIVSGGALNSTHSLLLYNHSENFYRHEIYAIPIPTAFTPIPIPIMIHTAPTTQCDYYLFTVCIIYYQQKQKLRETNSQQ